MKTHIKSITVGLALIFLVLLPVACNKTPEENMAKENADAVLDESIVDWEFEELTVTELRAVPLSESFERAREAFVSGDTAGAIEQIKLVADFFAREAETRSGENQEAFEEYSQELSELASLLETEGDVTEEDLDEIFANAHLILALDRAASAQAAARENHPEEVTENVSAAIDHTKQALRQIGKITTNEISKAGEAISQSLSTLNTGAELAKEKTISAANKTRDYTFDITRLVGEKIKEGKESTTRKTKEVTGELIERTGKAVEKMGKRMETTGSKIKPETTDQESSESGQ